jgi:hypothetical protein
MNDDLNVLKQFLEIPVGSSDGVFDLFRQIPNMVFKGEKQKRFLYVKGFRQDKVLLVAHADTVWDKNYKKPFDSKQEVLFDDGIFRSVTTGCGIGADDRAGCAMLWLLKDMGHSLLVTDGEEHHQAGAAWLMSHNEDIAHEINRDHQFVVELDRCNGGDFKCYKVGTDEFRRDVAKETDYNDADNDKKLFTDITKLCKSITGVNLSIGYYNEHHSNEYLKVEEWKNTLDLCKRWLGREDLPRYILK